MEPQEMLNEGSDAFVDHDLARLRGMSMAKLREQSRARELLFDYVDELWEDLKEAGLDPATKLEYSAIAGMRDLTRRLADSVVEAGGDEVYGED